MREYRQIYRDMYEFHEKHLNMETPEDCKSFAGDIDKLTKKYKGAKFPSALLVAIAREIDMCNRSRKQLAKRFAEKEKEQQDTP